MHIWKSGNSSLQISYVPPPISYVPLQISYAPLQLSDIPLQLSHTTFQISYVHLHTFSWDSAISGKYVQGHESFQQGSLGPEGEDGYCGTPNRFSKVLPAKKIGVGAHAVHGPANPLRFILHPWIIPETG